MPANESGRDPSRVDRGSQHAPARHAPFRALAPEGVPQVQPTSQPTHGPAADVQPAAAPDRLAPLPVAGNNRIPIASARLRPLDTAPGADCSRSEAPISRSQAPPAAAERS